jgi:Zn-dependent oligopeptidase
MSADAFGAFEEVGLENEEKVQEVGRKFRDTVLSKVRHCRSLWAVASFLSKIGSHVVAVLVWLG